MKKSASLIGFGNVGKTLFHRLEKMPQFEVQAIKNSKRIFDANFAPITELPRTDVVFISIPTTNNGHEEMAYLEQAITRDQIAVTCAKGVAAEHYDKIDKYRYVLGISASVGCSTRMVGTLREVRREYGQVSKLQGIVNGSLNYAFDRRSKGIPEGRVIFELNEKGLVESNELKFGEMLEQEINDARLKSAILFNEAFYPEDFVRASQIKMVDNYKEIVEEARANPNRYRFAVTINSSRDNLVSKKVFHFENKSHRLTGSFIPINDLLEDLKLEGADNFLMIYDTKGKLHQTYKASGAGAYSTACVMIGDARRLLRIPIG